MNVYVVTNTVNGKQYVGITAGPVTRRWASHLYHTRRGSNLLFHRAIRKYGAHVFALECVATTDSYSSLCVFEIAFIDALGSRSPGGYNATDGGEGALGYHHTEAGKAKLAALHTNPSAERRAQISSIWLGRKRSFETRAKMSEANLRRAPPSAESKLKMSLSASARHTLERFLK
jgi:group I intron endonuclease